MLHALFHGDGNGKVTGLIGPNGQLRALYLSDPFGAEQAAMDPLASAKAVSPQQRGTAPSQWLGHGYNRTGLVLDLPRQQAPVIVF